MNNQALFARTTDGRWLRLSGWVPTTEADSLYEGADRLQGKPGLMTLGVDKTPISYLALRPEVAPWTEQEVAHDNTLTVWSATAYTQDTAAAKAWNKHEGSPLVGCDGGWIVGRTTGQVYGQGWAKVARDRLLRTDHGWRYRVARISVARLERSVTWYSRANTDA